MAQSKAAIRMTQLIARYPDAGIRARVWATEDMCPVVYVDAHREALLEAAAKVPVYEPPMHLDCACWCGRSIVRVTRQDVREGRTGSCFRNRTNPGVCVEGVPLGDFDAAADGRSQRGALSTGRYVKVT